MRRIYKIGEFMFSTPVFKFFIRKNSLNERFLIVRRGAIGDVLMTTPLVRAIREEFPDAYIAYLTGEWSKGALEGNPNINDIVTFKDEVWLKKFRYPLKKIRMLLELRKMGFQTVISCDGEFWFNACLFFIGASRRIGFDIEGSGFSLTHKIKTSIASMHSGEFHRVQGMLNLLKSIGIDKPRHEGIELNISDRDRRSARDFLKGCGVKDNDAFIALAPGGGDNPGMTQSVKRWHPEGFAKVGDELKKRLGAKIIIVGKGKTDKLLSEKVRNLMQEESIDAVDRFNLKEVAALLKGCVVFVSNDCGLMHAASSTGAPQVAIFGPTNPGDCGPYSKNSRVVRKILHCSNCYRLECETHECMKKITAEDVIEAVNSLVGEDCGYKYGTHSL